jgi:hypothetical protein
VLKSSGMQAAEGKTSKIEAEVLRIRSLTQAARHQDALAAAQALLVQVPENRLRHWRHWRG